MSRIIVKQNDKKPWGKLITTNEEKVSSTDLIDSTITIGRTNTNTIQIDDSRISNKHCELIYENGCCYLLDVSTNGTYLGKNKIGKDKKQLLQTGDQFYVLVQGKLIKKQDTIGFVFIQLEIPQKIKIQEDVFEEPSKILQKPSDEKKNSSIIKSEPQLEKTQPLILEQQEKPSIIQSIIDVDKYLEEFTCTICTQVFYQPVILIPCLHSFCGACLSTWIKTSKECPNCRKTITSARKNVQMSNLLEIFLKANPEKDRDENEKKQLNSVNTIQNEMDFSQQRKPDLLPYLNQLQRSSVFQQFRDYRNMNPIQNPISIFENQFFRNSHYFRQHLQQQDENSDYSDEDLQEDFQEEPQEEEILLNSPINVMKDVIQQNQRANRTNCLQCRDNICVYGQPHGACMSCGRLMPNLQLSYPENEIKKHKCQFCQKLFCNIINGRDNCNIAPLAMRLYSLKDHQKPNLINLRWVRDFSVEFQKIQRHFQTSPNIKNFAQLFEHMMNTYVSIKMFQIVSNKEIYRNPLRIFDFPLSLETPFCNQCFQEVCFQVLLRYCIIYRDEIGNGPIIDCWNGINCTNKSSEHTRNYNHLCEQTRFA